MTVRFYDKRKKKLCKKLLWVPLWPVPKRKRINRVFTILWSAIVMQSEKKMNFSTKSITNWYVNYWTEKRRKMELLTNTEYLPFVKNIRPENVWPMWRLFEIILKLNANTYANAKKYRYSNEKRCNQCSPHNSSDYIQLITVW